MSELPFLGNFEVGEIPKQEMSWFEENDYTVSHNPFFRVQINDRPCNPSTVWHFFAEDVVDGSINFIRFEPRLLAQSPINSVPANTPVSLFNTSPLTARGNTLFIYLNFKENPLQWTRSVQENQLDVILFNHLKPRAKTLFEKRGEDFESFYDSSFLMAGFGLVPAVSQFGAFVIISKRDPMYINDSHSFFDHLGRSPGTHNQSAYTHCEECGSEKKFDPVNFRNEQGRYMLDCKRCAGCGLIKRIGS
jgi:hypothetical protein